MLGPTGPCGCISCFLGVNMPDLPLIFCNSSGLFELSGEESGKAPCISCY